MTHFRKIAFVEQFSFRSSLYYSRILYEKPQSTHRVTIATFWCTFHHDGIISPAVVRVGRGARPPPFHYIYIMYVQSFGVRSSWEGRYTLPISTLPRYVLCVCKTVKPSTLREPQGSLSQLSLQKVLETVNAILQCYRWDFSIECNF